MRRGSFIVSRILQSALQAPAEVRSCAAAQRDEDQSSGRSFRANDAPERNAVFRQYDGIHRNAVQRLASRGASLHVRRTQWIPESELLWQRC
jgi:hypothetical protein